MTTIDSKNLLVWVKAMSRGQALPLDSSEVHASLADAQTYASSPTAYGGQTIKALLEDGKYHEYILQPTDNGYALEEVGTTSSADSAQCIVVVESLPETGEENVIYICNDEAYFWDGTKFTCLSKPADLTTLETRIEKVESTISEIVFEAANDYEISHKPDDTLIDYRDKEIRVMCPVDTQWVLQNSGEGADANAYYIGMKAYAPNDDVASFKEDLAEIISDNEMYYFEGNDFAGIDVNGRKYSIVWLPVARYENDTWTYYGANSTVDHYIGWYYSVEWYNADGKIVASDCIRINLSNEECYSFVKPYYVGEVMKEVETKIEEKITEVAGIQIVEF